MRRVGILSGYVNTDSVPYPERKANPSRSFVTRRLFLEQPQFQCEISAKSTLSYTAALQSERKETELLHSRFPRGVKRAVLAAGQFRMSFSLLLVSAG